MDTNRLKLKSILKTIPVNKQQIENILNIYDNRSKEIDDLREIVKEEVYSYGIEKDFRIETSEAIRVGNPDLHRDLPIHNLMRGCLLDDDGNIVEYLPQNDWTTTTRDGSKGQVMVHIPAHYRKFYTKDEGNIIGVRISLYPIKGYHYVPDMFIGAYEAALDRVNNKLCSVVNNNPDFRGGNYQSSWDNTYRSLLGRPCTAKNRIEFQQLARNRGSIYWNSYLYQCHQTLCWLYVIEYANFNCQLGYNGQLTSSGYHQGGLGNGVTNLNQGEHSGFNNFNPFIPCGFTDSLGNNTGTINYTLYTENDTMLKTTSVPRYRGIENPFGHIWKYLEGINIIISADAANGNNILSKVYVCDDLNKFSNTSINDYTYIGDTVITNGYIKTLIFGENGCIFASSVGGTSTYPIGDYCYSADVSSNNSLNIVLIGGLSYLKDSAGLFYNILYYTPSYNMNYIGTRLCYVKNNLKIETL